MLTTSCDTVFLQIGLITKSSLLFSGASRRESERPVPWTTVTFWKCPEITNSLYSIMATHPAEAQASVTVFGRQWSSPANVCRIVHWPKLSSISSLTPTVFAKTYGR